MTDRRVFYEQFGVWPVARPYAGLMFDEAEIRLILALAGGPLTAGQIAAALDLAPGAARALAERAYRRLMGDREGQESDVRYRATDFYTFLDHFLKYENWDDLPLEARRAIDARYLAEFVDRVRGDVAHKMAGGETPGGGHNDAVLLLHEAEAMVRAAGEIVIQPCNCRRAGQYCDRPVETCIWMDEAAREARARGHGRCVSTEEAVALLRRADRAGLMRTGDSQWRTNGLGAICNCCACDCYPFRAAEVLGSKGVWPRSRYLAAYDADLCSLCGACVRRCHFGAFYHDGATRLVDGKERKAVSFDPARCWGCGLCANTCPTEAIVMERI
ncbi:MAG: 4Fe-4S binding protein [Anaerolineae bacterium]